MNNFERKIKLNLINFERRNIKEILANMDTSFLCFEIGVKYKFKEKQFTYMFLDGKLATLKNRANRISRKMR